MGIEDIIGYFHYGLYESVNENPIQAKGLKTYHDLDLGKPLEVRHIMGVVEVNKDFGRVKDIQLSDGRVTFVDMNGQSVSTEIDAGFLHSD